MHNIFVITQQPFESFAGRVLITYLIATPLLSAIAFRVKNSYLRGYLILGVVGGVLSCCFSIVPYIHDRSIFNQALRAYKNHDYQLAQGKISDYTIFQGGFRDCFDLDSQHFCISPLDKGPGFHRTRARGQDELHDGAQAVIAYHGATILQVDAAE
jgi:hypothetical protein